MSFDFNFSLALAIGASLYVCIAIYETHRQLKSFNSHLEKFMEPPTKNDTSTLRPAHAFIRLVTTLLGFKIHSG